MADCTCGVGIGRGFHEGDCGVVRLNETRPASLTIAHPSTGRHLLSIHGDGRIEVSTPEDATEAAQVFFREIRRMAGQDPDSNLVAHARRELELLGEEEATIQWYCRVVAEFASFGHSGGSASVTIPVLNELLQYRALTDLTDDPDEWIDHTEISDGHPTFQNKRQSEAFSEDGGTTYYLLSERTESLETTPLHRSTHKEPK